MRVLTKSLVFVVTVAIMQTPLSAQISIYKTVEAKQFRGALDPLSAPSAWQPRLERWAMDFCRVFNTARLNRHKQNPELYGSIYSPSSTDMFQLFATDLIPSQTRTNYFAKATEPYEARLRSYLIREPNHSLEPADVMRLAMKATNGDYKLATLTAHSVLKETTKAGRGIIQNTNRLYGTLTRMRANQKKYPNRPTTSTNKLAKTYGTVLSSSRLLLRLHNEVTLPLKSLRADPSKTNDKMGPWYHIFALYAIDALADHREAADARDLEHLGKKVKAFKNESGYNREKHVIDTIFSSTQTNLGKRVECQKPAITIRTANIAPPRPQATKAQLRCPKIRWPLKPAYKLHWMQTMNMPGNTDDNANYSPGKVRRVSMNPDIYTAYCIYDRYGKDFKIAMRWDAAPGTGIDSNAEKICGIKWGHLDHWRTNYLFNPKRKAITIAIGNPKNGNRMPDNEILAAVQFLEQQIRTKAFDCRPPRNQ